MVRLKQTPDALLFRCARAALRAARRLPSRCHDMGRCLNQPQAVDLVESLLSDYLQLNVRAA